MSLSIKTTLGQFFAANVIASEAVPEDQMALYQPGESVNLITPDGTTIHVEIKSPKVAWLKNLGKSNG